MQKFEKHQHDQTLVQLQETMQVATTLQTEIQGLREGLLSELHDKVTQCTQELTNVQQELAETTTRIASAIDQHSTAAQAKAVRDALTLTGAGNHPAIVGLFARMSARLTESGAVAGGGPAEVSNPSAIMYPNHNPVAG
jgi:chromosome segregation ATPase